MPQLVRPILWGGCMVVENGPKHCPKDTRPNPQTYMPLHNSGDEILPHSSYVGSTAPQLVHHHMDEVAWRTQVRLAGTFQGRKVDFGALQFIWRFPRDTMVRKHDFEKNISICIEH